MTVNYSGVIKKLKQLKTERGLTNEALAERSGVSLGTVNKLFAGSIGSIKLGTLASLAEALEAPLGSLLSIEERAPVTPPKPKRADNFGFVRVGVATPEIRVADVGYNAAGIIEAAEKASREGSKLLVLPELSLTGYTCGDLFYQQTLLEGAEKHVDYIARRTAGLGLMLIFGAPIRKDGRIYNCAVVCCNGQILGVVPKTYLPNYNEFYDKRQFNPAPSKNGEIIIMGKRYPFGKDYIFQNEDMPEMCVGVEICEDLWVAEPPSVRLSLNGATVIANLSCSDETIGKAEYRRSLISMQASKTFTAYLYANAGEGESTTDMVFSGHSIICDNGKILSETKLFENGDIYAEVDLSLIEFERSKFTNYSYPSEGGVEKIYFSLPVEGVELKRTYAKTPFVPPKGKELNERAELILNMQAHALKKRIKHIGISNVVLGISGGLDSTLALLVCARAFDLLGKDRKGIHAITMPCFGTTSRTYNNAVRLTELLGCSLECVDIKESVLEHFRNIGHDPSVTNITYENSQARERTQVLMDMSNKYGGIVVGTGDLSELALGWATYNGDHMSMYAVNSSIPKTLIRYLIEYEAGSMNREVKAVLEDILDTPVSPELLPHDNDSITQKTEDVVGPYILHDFFLFHMLRNGFKPSKIYHLAVKTFKGDFKEQTIYRWLNTFVRRFFSQQFKRSCMPDGVKIGSVTLSPRGDWRMPSDATCRLWLEDLENIERRADDD
ncbi:MAG: NAD(+) synthase [Clostridia bacterium]|nr:NAD(+) synthase [Clostridia bacterium]